MKAQLKRDRQCLVASGQDAVSFPNRLSAYPILSNPSLERLLGIEAFSHQIVRPRGSVLFTEGQKIQGVHALWERSVKISMGSGNGKSLLLGLVGRGAVLDLPAAILGLPHAATATVVKSTRAVFSLVRISCDVCAGRTLQPAPPPKW